jgi:2-keto-4-pentenoate hydratase/2-oxohepta-3-ene-1,7-dioic acid hydratase in catechol pathway
VRIARASLDGVPTYCEVDGDVLHVLEGGPFAGARRTGERHPIEGVTLLAPVDPGRTFAVLGGFFDPGSEPAERGQPVLCPKVVPTTSGDGGEVASPPFLESLAVEAEMALVVGRQVRSATPEEAAGAIWGFTCYNDVTAAQYFPQFWLAKGLETFASMGPWVRTDLTDDQIRHGLGIVARVNGATVQSGTTARYKFSPAEVVCYLSGFFTLHPGDVVTLGTPPPPADVRPGDVVEIEVEGIGVLTNHVVAGTSDRRT